MAAGGRIEKRLEVRRSRWDLGGEHRGAAFGFRSAAGVKLHCMPSLAIMFDRNKAVETLHLAEDRAKKHESTLDQAHKIVLSTMQTSAL